MFQTLNILTFISILNVLISNSPLYVCTKSFTIHVSTGEALKFVNSHIKYNSMDLIVTYLTLT